jgi:hypothetical protein
VICQPRHEPSGRYLLAWASQELPDGRKVTSGVGTHSIMPMPIAAAAGRPPAWGTPAWRAPAPLTRRRTVDYCRVATALCPGPPRRRQTA